VGDRRNLDARRAHDHEPDEALHGRHYARDATGQDDDRWRSPEHRDAHDGTADDTNDRGADDHRVRCAHDGTGDADHCLHDDHHAVG
jgi:hypothetical protein